MPVKIINYFIILSVIFSFSPAFAQIEAERTQIVSATLDEIEQGISEQKPLAAEEKEENHSVEFPSQAKAQSFLSDFYITNPLIDIISLHQRLTSPILCLQEDEQIPDLPKDFSLSSEAKTVELSFPTSVGTGEEFIKLSLGTHYGYSYGHTNYEIGFDGGKSELEFPLESISVVGARLATTFPKMRLVLDNVGYVNTRDKSGDMYDTDWGANDILTSDTKSNAYLNRLLIWDSSLGYVVWQNSAPDYYYDEWDIAVSVLGGYKHEYFKYMIYDVYDVSTNVCLSTGQALKYRVTYNIPYFGLKFNLGRKETDWGLSTRACFSPFARANDVDDHLLRGKRSFGECNGWAALVGTNLFWNLKDHWTLQAGLDYTHIRTSGEQVQTWYLAEGSTPAGTIIEDIDDDIFSRQIYYWGRISYQF